MPKGNFGSRWVRVIERYTKWSFYGILAVFAVVVVTNLIR